jgi:hypothetical protein
MPGPAVSAGLTGTPAHDQNVTVVEADAARAPALCARLGRTAVAATLKLEAKKLLRSTGLSPLLLDTFHATRQRRSEDCVPTDRACTHRSLLSDSTSSRRLNGPSAGTWASGAAQHGCRLGRAVHSREGLFDGFVLRLPDAAVHPHVGLFHVPRRAVRGAHHAAGGDTGFADFYHCRRHALRPRRSARDSAVPARGGAVPRALLRDGQGGGSTARCSARDKPPRGCYERYYERSYGDASRIAGPRASVKGHCGVGCPSPFWTARDSRIGAPLIDG